VDDDVDVISIMETILKKEGYEVDTAVNKKEGLARLRNNKPDLAILDVIMTTRYEGFEMAREILDNPEFSDIPFLIQSSIEILETANPNVRDMAREFRRVPNLKGMQVLLIRNINDGSAGVDYKDEEGNTHWFSVRGFIRKPVDAQKVKEESRKHLK